jgi:hypothetical protein
MERLNGEIRDREKTMRGLKKMDTPSEACGIEINGDNKWLTLIQNASRRET